MSVALRWLKLCFISDFFAASIEIFNRCYEQKELRRDIMAFFISYFLVVGEIWRAGFGGVKIILLIKGKVHRKKRKK